MGSGYLGGKMQVHTSDGFLVLFVCFMDFLLTGEMSLRWCELTEAMIGWELICPSEKNSGTARNFWSWLGKRKHSPLPNCGWDSHVCPHSQHERVTFPPQDTHSLHQPYVDRQRTLASNTFLKGFAKRRERMGASDWMYRCVTLIQHLSDYNHNAAMGSHRCNRVGVEQELPFLSQFCN